jgi:ABC-type glycerol-3-phosphate transport system substrate-binding protein
LYAAECVECPDLWTWGGRPKLLELAKAGFIQPIPVDMMPNYQKNIVAQNINTKGFEVDGVLYNLPGFVYYSGIFYDRNVWDDLGLGDEPTTYEEVWELLERIKEIGRMPVLTMGNGEDISWRWDVMGIPAYLDPNWVSDLAAGKNKFTDEEFVACWRDARAIIEKGYAPPDNWALNYETLHPQFALGEIALSPNGGWIFAGAKEVNPDVELEAFLVPPVGGGKPIHLIWGRDMGMVWLNAKTPVEPAARFLDFMLSDEWWITLIKEVAFPPLWPIQTEADYTGTAGERLARLIAKGKDTIASLWDGDDLKLAGVVPGDVAWSELYASVFTKFVTGEVSPEEAAAELQEEVEGWGTITFS